jgi:hypothetical protein
VKVPIDRKAPKDLRVISNFSRSSNVYCLCGWKIAVDNQSLREIKIDLPYSFRLVKIVGKHIEMAFFGDCVYHPMAIWKISRNMCRVPVTEAHIVMATWIYPLPESEVSVEFTCRDVWFSGVDTGVIFVAIYKVLSLLVNKVFKWGFRFFARDS